MVETFEIGPSTPLGEGLFFPDVASRFVSEIEVVGHDDVRACGGGFLFRGLRPMPESSVGARLIETQRLVDWSGIAERVLGARWSYFRSAVRGSVRSFFDARPAARGGWVTNGWSANYYHWFAEALPKILVLKRVEPDLPILLPGALERLAFVTASLDLLGIGDVQFVPATRSLRVARLLTVADLAPGGRQRPDLAREIGARLREAVAARSPGAVARRKVFISRTGSAMRKFVNESDLHATLEAAGYAVVSMETLSFAEQVALMSGCDSLVATHGAGLTNMSFMPTGGKVLEFRIVGNPDCFLSLASALGHRHFCASPGQAVAGDAAHWQNFSIDPLDFAATLSAFDAA